MAEKKLSYISKHGADTGDGKKAVAVIEHFSDGSESEPMIYDLGDPDEVDALRDHERAADHGESITLELEPETPLAEADFQDYKRRRKAGES